jgi:hypothetical protein
MAPLERCFALEVEFHRKLRMVAVSPADTAALHTSYALQSGYEPLLRTMGRVTVHDIERLAQRYLLVDDARDVRDARESVTRLVGLGP